MMALGSNGTMGLRYRMSESRAHRALQESPEDLDDTQHLQNAGGADFPVF
jgi:hypothetical protein